MMLSNQCVFRPVVESDLKGLHDLTQQCGHGLTSLPKDIENLSAKLDKAIQSMSALSMEHKPALFWFVLEDLNSNEIIGCSAIEAKIGLETPFYAYKKSKRTKPNLHVSHRTIIERDLLFLVNDHFGFSELCTLYLNNKHRNKNLGAFLSRARFMFMAQFPGAFSQTIIAEMRGITNAEGESPFWNAIGHHFFDCSFIEADQKTLSSDKQFIADLMPDYPIYTCMLDKHAQQAIGQTHPHTESALSLLLNEGFRFNQYIDIFDAGPMLEAPLSAIKTIQASKNFIIENIIETIEPGHPDTIPCFISNTSRDFKATQTYAVADHSTHLCHISRSCAEIINVNIGDNVLIKT